MKVFIELEFEEMPSQADLENYLRGLMCDNSLDWYLENEGRYRVNPPTQEENNDG